MVEALAAAVERLRARMAESAAPAPPGRDAEALLEPTLKQQRSAPPAPVSAARRAPERAGVPSHKHSMSLIGRLRMLRKQRRQR
jgi:hypothetical protein